MDRSCRRTIRRIRPARDGLVWWVWRERRLGRGRRADLERSDSQAPTPRVPDRERSSVDGPAVDGMVQSGQNLQTALHPLSLPVERRVVDRARLRSVCSSSRWGSSTEERPPVEREAAGSTPALSATPTTRTRIRPLAAASTSWGVAVPPHRDRGLCAAHATRRPRRTGTSRRRRAPPLRARPSPPPRSCRGGAPG